MAGASSTLAIKIVADAAGASKVLDQTARKTGDLAGTFKKATLPIAVAGAALFAVGKAAVTSASDQQQAIGGVQAVYGKYAAGVLKSSESAAKSVGMSATAYDTMAAQIGGQLKAAGVPMDQLGAKTQDLIKRGADLATTYGGSTTQAVDALSSAFRGEADPAERFNLQLSASAVNAELARRGQSKLTGSALAAAKVQATSALIMRQSSDAAGQFAVQTNTLAEQQQIAAANFENAKAKLGNALLPAMTAAAGVASSLAGFISDNSSAFLILGGILAGIAVVVLVVNGAMAAYAAGQTLVTGVTKIFTAVQKALNASFLTSPLFLIIAGIVLLVAAFILAYQHCTTFRNVVNAVLNFVKVIAGAVAAFFARVFTVAFRAVATYVRIYIAVVVAIVRGIVAVVTVVAHAVAAGFMAAVRAVAAGWTAGVHAIQAVIRAIVGVVSAVAHAISAGFMAAIHAVVSGWTSGVHAVTSVIRAITGVVSSVAGSIRSRLVGAFDAIAGKARSIGGALMSPFQGLSNFIGGVIGRVQDLIGWLGSIASHIPHISLPGFLGEASADGVLRAVPAGVGVQIGAMSTTPRLYAAVGGAGMGLTLASNRTGTTGATINIYGALDPVAVARQVKAILAADDRRTGGVVIARRAA